jgi:ribose transport system substrate-binding protein
MRFLKTVRWSWRVLALCSLLVGQAWAKECIGVVPASAQLFWSQVKAGALQAGLDVGVEIYFRGPIREGSVEVQAQLIDKVVARGCKALVIAPSGAELNAKVRALKARGIPTIYIDRDAGGSEVRALIATNNYRAGQLAGQHLGQALRGKGRVGVMQMSPAATSTSERRRGFIQAVRAAGLTIVFDQPLGGNPDTTFKVLREQLPQLDALFTTNGSTTRETHAALLRLQATGQLLHVGFDTGQVLLDALRAGQIDALVVQQPYAMGYQGVRLAERAMREPRVATPRQHIELDAVLVTRERLDSPEVKALLAMPESL